MYTRIRAGLAGLVIAGSLVGGGIVGASPAAAASCAHHTTGVCKANSAHPRGAMAKCKDGTYSYSKHFSGTCSHHKGVRYWYK